MTLPRILAVDNQGALTYTVAPEVKALEADTLVHGKHLNLAQAQTLMRRVAGDSLVIHATIASSSTVEFVVRHDPTSGEQTCIRWEPITNELVCDMSQSSHNQNTAHDTYRATLNKADRDMLTLSIYVDRSIIEIYAGVHTVCSLRVYPTHAANRYQITCAHEVTCHELIVRSMRSIW